jgi:crossover junction endodeoxyribonuclease RuvC
MRRVVGLDLDLAKCGIGIITHRPDRGDCLVTSARVTAPLRKTGPVNVKGKSIETLSDRHSRIVDIAGQACHVALTAELVMIENKFAGSPGGKSIDRHGAYWWVVGRCLRKGIAVVEVAPASVKLAIAGDGRADKAKVSGALARLWPDFAIGSEDEADAVGLAHLGAVYLGWPVATLERHRHIKVEWPVFVNRERNDDVA